MLSEPMETLTNRQLNRATLARQMLLERSDMGIADAVAFLGGLQAQQSNDPYIALWSRLIGFTQEQLTALIVDRTLARATTMRGTLHLHTADDLIGVRALVGPFLKGMWSSNFRKRFGSEDERKVRRAGVKLLDAKAPMTAGALGKALQEKFPTAEPQSLAVLLQVTETLVQVPPTRLWGNGSAPLLTRVENWLPEPHTRPLSRVDLVRRYLWIDSPHQPFDCRIAFRYVHARDVHRSRAGEIPRQPAHGGQGRAGRACTGPHARDAGLHAGQVGRPGREPGRAAAGGTLEGRRGRHVPHHGHRELRRPLRDPEQPQGDGRGQLQRKGIVRLLVREWLLGRHERRLTVRQEEAGIDNLRLDAEVAQEARNGRSLG